MNATELFFVTCVLVMPAAVTAQQRPNDESSPPVVRENVTSATTIGGIARPVVWEVACVYVYEDVPTTRSSTWQPDGWMPADGASAISSLPGCTENPTTGSRTCHRIRYNTMAKDWAGIYWLPRGGWKGPGPNLLKALGIRKGDPVRLTFWARGETGGEKAEFKVGGMSTANDSMDFPKGTGYITLTREWRQYTIDLTNEDLSRLAGCFCWVSNAINNPGKTVVTIYLDNIRFEHPVRPIPESR